jgi:hypothetical protein
MRVKPIENKENSPAPRTIPALRVVCFTSFSQIRLFSVGSENDSATFRVAPKWKLTSMILWIHVL